MSDYEIEWCVDDGYVNPGPQCTEFSLHEFDSDSTVDEIKLYLADTIQEDFEQRVHWRYSDEDQLDSVAEQIYNDLNSEED